MGIVNGEVLATPLFSAEELIWVGKCKVHYTEVDLDANDFNVCILFVFCTSFIKF